MFKELPFSNALIKNPYIKHFDNIDMLREIPFHKERSAKTLIAFKKYARSYRIEIVDSKDPSYQLTISKPGIKTLFKDLLNEIKGFKY